MTEVFESHEWSSALSADIQKRTQHAERQARISALDDALDALTKNPGEEAGYRAIEVLRKEAEISSKRNVGSETITVTVTGNSLGSGFGFGFGLGPGGGGGGGGGGPIKESE